jgi:hypothetical protein
MPYGISSDPDQCNHSLIQKAQKVDSDKGKIPSRHRCLEFLGFLSRGFFCRGCSVAARELIESVQNCQRKRQSARLSVLVRLHFPIRMKLERHAHMLIGMDDLLTYLAATPLPLILGRHSRQGGPGHTYGPGQLARARLFLDAITRTKLKNTRALP